MSIISEYLKSKGDSGNSSGGGGGLSRNFIFIQDHVFDFWLFEYARCKTEFDEIEQAAVYTIEIKLKEQEQPLKAIYNVIEERNEKFRFLMSQIQNNNGKVFEV